MDKEEPNDFTASNGWLESWNTTYGVREKRLCGEADYVSTTAIKAWIEHIPELCQGYEPQNILNLDQTYLRLYQKKDWQRKIETTNDSIWQLMVLLFSSPLLFGNQKHHGVLDLSEVRQDQCLFIIFQIAKYG